jgi:hypothetical protein
MTARHRSRTPRAEGMGRIRTTNARPLARWVSADGPLGTPASLGPAPNHARLLHWIAEPGAVVATWTDETHCLKLVRMARLVCPQQEINPIVRSASMAVAKYAIETGDTLRASGLHLGVIHDLRNVRRLDSRGRPRAQRPVGHGRRWPTQTLMLTLC